MTDKGGISQGSIKKTKTVDIYELRYIRSVEDVPNAIDSISLILCDDGERISFDDCQYIIDSGDGEWHTKKRVAEKTKLVKKSFPILDKDGKKYIVIDSVLEKND